MPNIAKQLDAILRHAAIARIGGRAHPEIARAFLRITGSDATRWLNGMVTNSIQSLAPGEGNYNFLLNAQGRILADCTIYRQADPVEPASYLLATTAPQLKTIQNHLDHFIIMDDVELQPALAGEQSLLLLGPDAPQALKSLGLPTPSTHRLTIAYVSESPVAILTSSIEDRFELRADPDTLTVLRKSMGLPEVSAEALEALRILEARPLYGRDITDRYLPQETNQPQALHFAKGCYLGQEIVERIRSRGQVHRLLTPLTLTGQLPAELPTPLHAAHEEPARSVGEITSAALVPLPEGPQLLALGYVRREALEGPQTTHQPLTYNGGTATPRTTSKLTEPTHA
ncbi:MAG TPA: folate-binding protein [Acidobacteriaceae bacterium]|jgi:folate-binding protein YgfZ|nr:folate-binding protein [Acidobacteriaceae bacterium]